MTWRVASRKPLTPARRAASKCGRTTTALVSPRITRAYQGHHTIVTAIRVLMRLGPRATATAIAITGPGSARPASVIRISTVSTQPPRIPATSPTIRPKIAPTPTTARAENHEVRVP